MFGSRDSIRQRLLIIITLISAAMLIVVAGVSLSISADALRREAENTLVTHDAVIAQQLDIHLHEIEEMIEGLGEQVEEQGAIETSSDFFNMVVDALDSDIQELISRVYFFHDGTIRLYESPAVTPNTTGRLRVLHTNIPADSWIRGMLDGGGAGWHGPDSAFVTSTDELMMSYATTFELEGEDGDIEPVIIWAEIPITGIQALIDQIILQERLVLEYGEGYSVLYQDDEHIVAAYDLSHEVGDTSTSTIQATPSDALSTLIAKAPSSNDTPLLAGVSDPETGALMLLVHHELGETGWNLLTVFPEDALPNVAGDTILRIAFISIFSIAVLIWIVNNFVDRMVAAPLGDLSIAAQEIGSGDMRYQITHKERTDEIGRMAIALDDMKRNLAASYDELSRWGRTLEQRVDERTKELDEARKQAQAAASELRAVYDESLSVVNEQRLQPILDAFVNRMLTLLSASYCSVWLLSSDGERLQLVASTAVEQAASNITVKTNEGMVGRVTQSGLPMRLADYTNWPQRVNLDRGTSGEVSRAMCVPLMFGGRPIGAAVVGRPADSPEFSDEDERKMTLFANMVSPSVRNAQLFVQLNAAVQEAERANMVKTRFLASVTHELRTPLNLIINNMDFMRIGAFGDVTPEQISRLDQTIRSAEHLLYLINDLLDVSKIEAGEMSLFIQENDLAPIITDVLEAGVMMLEKDQDKSQKVALQAKIPETLPQVPMDARRIRQVLNNLVSNAIKFTQEGSVTLTVEIEDEFIRFSVTDTGIGIPDDEMDALFEAFERTSRAKELGIEGTGLGLPISKHLVEQHGGQMTVTTKLGEGSTFSFTLPLKQSEAKQEDTETRLKKPDTVIMQALSVDSAAESQESNGSNASSKTPTQSE